MDMEDDRQMSKMSVVIDYCELIAVPGIFKEKIIWTTTAGS